MTTPSTRPASALEILIADDDELLCAHLEALLAERGLNALSVNSLELAREAMRAVHFPVLIVDRELGDGDGADLCREYRAKQSGKRVRILMLSTRDSPEETQFALESGADEFISKRSGDVAVVERIRRLHELATKHASGPAADAEAARLRALADYAILDSSSEAAFDDITLIASTLFKMPIAAISLIDAKRQWFKSKVGIDADETPRELAFCAHTIQDAGRVLVVNDAQRDARFAAHPLVTDGAQRIRFYAGAPIVTGEGLALGSMCVIDVQPREFSVDEQRALQALARQVMYLLEQRRISNDFQQVLAARRTAEAELRRREALLRDAYEHEPIGRALVSTTGQWLQVNRAICEIVGYSAAELLQTTFQALTHPADLEADLKYVQDILAGTIRSYEMEKRYIHKQGHIVWALLNVSLVRDEENRPVFFVSQVQDITRRKRVERAKDQFFAVLNRELRAPVETLRRSLPLLSGSARDALPAEARAAFDLSLRSAERVQRLIDDVLDVEKTEESQFRS